MDNEDLKELNAIFKDMGGVEKVEDYTNTYENLPDGNYVGEIEKFSTKNSKKTGRPMIEIIVAVEGGKKEYVYMMLAGEDLKKLGVEGVELEDFIVGGTKLVGKRVNVKIATNGAFRNVELTLA